MTNNHINYSQDQHITKPPLKLGTNTIYYTLFVHQIVFIYTNIVSTPCLCVQLTASTATYMCTSIGLVRMRANHLR